MSDTHETQAGQPFLFDGMAERPHVKKGKKPPHPERAELLKIRDYYMTKVKPGSTQVEARGVIRMMEALLDKGFTTQQLWRAVKNYENDEFRCSSDKRFTRGIRAFFASGDTIVQWQNPVQQRKPKPRYVDPSIAALDRIAEARQAAPVPAPIPDQVAQDGFSDDTDDDNDGYDEEFIL